jgi:dihydropteroate synthase
MLQIASSNRGALRIRGRALPWGARTYVMGIVNLAPDSFSGDGVSGTDDAVLRALAQRDAGADFVDAGAESTRPGHRPIAPELEIVRLIPTIARLRSLDPSLIVSVDTYKPDVYLRAHAAGADILNSIWGAGPAIIDAARRTGSPLVAMHNAPVPVYDGDVVDEVLRFLLDVATRAVAAGIPPEHVIIDPGIGFGKTAEQNLRILGRLDRLVALGFPTLLGTSRKSTLGKLTGRPVDERAFGTAATVALAAGAGIDIVRVHDVREQVDVVRVSDAIARGWRPAGWPATR